jgi:nucleoside phosphorylase
MAATLLGLVIPLAEEFECAREILAFDAPSGKDMLHPFTVPGSKVRGVAVTLFDMGLVPAAAATTRLLNSTRVPLVALVGIAGALDSGLKLGDVVVASQIEEYMRGVKAVDSASGAGYEFQASGSTHKTDAGLLQFARNFPYLGTRGYKSWRDRGRQRRDDQAASRLPGLVRGIPEFAVMPIATGDVVGASEQFAEWLRGQNRRRAAIEMEAGGVAEAVHQDGKAKLLVIRGISDFADSRKSAFDAQGAAPGDRGYWRRYAALNAFDLLAALVQEPGFPFQGSGSGPFGAASQHPHRVYAATALAAAAVLARGGMPPDHQPDSAVDLESDHSPAADDEEHHSHDVIDDDGTHSFDDGDVPDDDGN